MLNGHVGRGAPEIPVLTGSGLLRRASVYVLVRQASNSARLTIRLTLTSIIRLFYIFASFRKICLSVFVAFKTPGFI